MALYVQQTWSDNNVSYPVSAARMQHMEAGIAAAVPADSVALLSARVLQNMLLAADAQPSFILTGDGKHQWGPGGATPPDTSLYRSAAGVLKTDGDVQSAQLLTQQGTAQQIQLASNGVVYFHSGQDCYIYRHNTSQLRAGLDFLVERDVYVGLAYNTAQIHFGTAADTNLYRSAAGVLKTDGVLNAVGGFQVNGVPLGTGGPKITTSSLSGGSPPSPGNTDIWIATDVDAAGTRWMFQYNAGSASPYKWEFVGGPPLRTFVSAEDTSASTSPVEAGSGGRITLPNAGDYLLTGSGALRAAASVQQMSLYIRDTAGVFTQIGQVASTNSSTVSGGASGSFPHTGATAGGYVNLGYRVNTGVAVFLGYKSLTALPIRIA